MSELPRRAMQRALTCGARPCGDVKAGWLALRARSAPRRAGRNGRQPPEQNLQLVHLPLQAIRHGALEERGHVCIYVRALLPKGRDGDRENGLHLLQAPHDLPQLRTKSWIDHKHLFPGPDGGFRTPMNGTLGYFSTSDNIFVMVCGIFVSLTLHLSPC